MNFREKSVREFWSFFDQRKFEMVRPLLHPIFEAYWVTTNEKFTSIDAFISVNQEYPGKWHTIPQEIILLEDKVLSIVSVFSKEFPDRFFVLSFFEFKAKLISKITEYWATVEHTPEWRKKFSIPISSGKHGS